MPLSVPYRGTTEEQREHQSTAQLALFLVLITENPPCPYALCLYWDWDGVRAEVAGRHFSLFPLHTTVLQTRRE